MMLRILAYRSLVYSECYT